MAKAVQIYCSPEMLGLILAAGHGVQSVTVRHATTLSSDYTATQIGSSLCAALIPHHAIPIVCLISWRMQPLQAGNAFEAVKSGWSVPCSEALVQLVDVD